ncbi:hypothetical protein [Streptomyces sp. NPDC058092]|uniref:hypothetical protein n=1 Tax=Streptomyces sp. NPDC058092 TaxID=3346336 RepID=UPI0036ECB02F
MRSIASTSRAWTASRVVEEEAGDQTPDGVVVQPLAAGHRIGDPAQGSGDAPLGLVKVHVVHLGPSSGGVG